MAEDQTRPTTEPDASADDVAAAVAEAAEAIAATTKAAPAAKAGRSRGTGAPTVLNERYLIYPASPLPALNSPNAPAFVAEDRRDVNNRLFALICDPAMPVRTNVMRAMKGVKQVGLLPLVDWGQVDWPPLRRVCRAVLFEEPLGGRVMSDPKQRIETIREHEVIKRVIQPFVSAIKEYSERGLTHRGIRPDNLFYMDIGKQQIILGECATAPPGYDQPVMCEPIPQGMAMREGRGPGTVETDLYAVGMLIPVLMTGRLPFYDLNDEQVLRSKILNGSYSTLVTDQRLPLPIIEILRGLLSDDPTQRWDLQSLELWLAGRRLSPIQAKPSHRSQRPFPVKGTQFDNIRELAHGIGQMWEASADAITNGSLELWLRRSLDDKERAEAIGAMVKLAELNYPDQRAMNDYVLIRAQVILDPTAPIRYRGLSLMPDGFGPALAVAIMQKRDVVGRLIAEAIAREIPRIWFDGHDEYSADYVFLNTEFREVRSFLNMTAVGYGIERALYELNEILPCQSPLIADRYVVEIAELLPALESIAATVDQKSWPVDRHVAAFINARYDYDLEAQMAALNDASPERACSGMLSVLAVMQYRGGPSELLGLASWCAALVLPVVNSYHSRERRKLLEREIPRVAKRGSLPQLFGLLDNIEEREKDWAGFNQAKVEFMAAEHDIAVLETGAKNRDGQSARIGHQGAAVASLVIALITVALLIIVRVW